MTGVVDYDAGNLTSVCTALSFLGEEHTIMQTPDRFGDADRIILPGVGDARYCMNVLTRKGLDVAVKTHVSAGKPFLGICLGFQLLFEFSEERHTDMLGLVPGRIVRFRPEPGFKVPHMGWNTLRHDNSALFRSIPQDSSFYFVHSYMFPAPDDIQQAEEGKGSTLVAAQSTYTCSFAAAVHSGNLWATQFHPEKSGAPGLQLLRNFLELDQEPRDP